jgi:hypothetical protein
VGKSFLLKQFEDCGFEVLDEAFMNMKESPLHPQSLVMETIWMSQWV